MTSSHLPGGTAVDALQVAASLDAEEQRLRALARTDPTHLHHHEASIHAQGGEDGIIREIFRRIGTTNRTFAELGSSDGAENCTRALVEDGWSGVWIEGDPDAAAAAREVVGSRAVEVVHAFIDRDNVAALLAEAGLPADPDLVVVDLDGNDLWIWDALVQRHRPRVVVLEYNSILGPWTRWVMPYDAEHQWDRTWRFGASLAAQADACLRHGYRLVGCDRLGVNAFYVRDELCEPFTDRPVHELYVGPRYQLPFGHPHEVPPTLTSSPPVADGALRLEVSLPFVRRLTPGERLYFAAAVHNGSHDTIGESGERPVRLAAWFEDHEGGPVGCEPARSIQPWQSPAGGVAGLVGCVIAPDKAGTYELAIGVVQEGVAWFGPPARTSGGRWTVLDAPVLAG